jgi:hypothetical protein
MQSFIFGGGSFGFPLPNSLFIFSINLINYCRKYKYPTTNTNKPTATFAIIAIP